MADRSFLPVGPASLPAAVWRFEDCCNVYALKAGDRALLIDLGSGAALGALSEIGVAHVEGIYLTHGDRDQAQGHARAAERGIPIHTA